MRCVFLLDPVHSIISDENKEIVVNKDSLSSKSSNEMGEDEFLFSYYFHFFLTKNLFNAF